MAAHTIYTNGRVRTMDAETPVAQALIVGADGRIVAACSLAEAEGFAGAGVRLVDLDGRTVVPGFFDCHMHLVWLGLNLGQLNLGAPQMRTAEDIVAALRAVSAAEPARTCILGNRYDQNRLEGGRHLTRRDLDRVSTDLPVRIEHTSGHASVVNSKALELLGITRDTPDPTGGAIERDGSGAPTGVLLETASWHNLDRILPEVGVADARAAVRRASEYLLQRGVTSACDANADSESLGWYARANEGGELQVRLTCMVGWAEVCAQSRAGADPSPNDLQPDHRPGAWHMLHAGQAKLFADGAITTRTCWLHEPFAGMPDNFGVPIHAPDALRDLICRAHSAGWQIATHAIGDRAIDEVLDAYAEAQRRHSRPHPGHRIEHCMLLNAEQIARLRRQNIWSIGQPEFLATLGDAYIAALGIDRASRLSPYASLERAGVAQAFSSDCPVVPGAPLDGISAAMLRCTPGGVVLNADERIDAETALSLYTLAPAFATRTDRDRGSLSPGKWADFTVLSADPVTTDATEWEEVQVEATIVAGECRFGADHLEGIGA